MSEKPPTDAVPLSAAALLATAAVFLMASGAAPSRWGGPLCLVLAIAAMMAAAGLALNAVRDEERRRGQGIAPDPVEAGGGEAPVRTDSATVKLVRRGHWLRAGSFVLVVAGVAIGGNAGSGAILLAMLGGVLYEVSVRRPLRRLSRQR